MATRPADRYASVGEFQEAIRQYWSHSQSVLLSDRADGRPARPPSSARTTTATPAPAGLPGGLRTLDGNTAAKEGIASTSLAYAKRALSKGNFDLAASLLDASIADHAALLRRRSARPKRNRTRGSNA